MEFAADSFEELYTDILSQLDKNPEWVTVGRNNEISKEILNLSFILTNPYNRLIWNKAREVNYEFAMRFFIWMINGCSDYEYVASVNPNATKFIDKPDGKTAQFSTAYGPRIVRQLPFIIDELKRNPGSRRAVISILDEADLAMLDKDTKEEFPCAESAQFFIRQGKLHCHVKMRSNNMATTLVYDVFNFTMLQEYVLNRLNADAKALVGANQLTMGNYYHNCGSAHFFTSQQELVDKVLANSEVAMLRR